MSFIIHATEEDAKVLSAISEGLDIGIEKFDKNLSNGHFGNPITMFNARILADRANIFVTKMFEKIKSVDKVTLSDQLKTHVDRHGTMYLRLNKQELFRNILELSQSDSIRIKIKPNHNRPLADTIVAYRRFIEAC